MAQVTLGVSTTMLAVKDLLTKFVTNIKFVTKIINMEIPKAKTQSIL